MKLLEERILKDGRALNEDVLKVDSFLNHQMDIELFNEMGKEWYHLFKDERVNKILTIEASGIGMACVATQVASFTHGIVNHVIVAKPYLNPEDRVLIIDDFLANGAALEGLIDLVQQAGATVVGAGIAVEKAFQPGGERIRAKGVRVESLARVKEMHEGEIVFC